MGVEYDEEEADPFNGLEIRIKPLFKLDLGSNGGLFQPKSLDELIAWLKAEVDFWNWLTLASNGNHAMTAIALIGQVAQVMSAAQSAKRQTDEVGRSQAIQEFEAAIYKVFVKSAFPHSSTKLAIQIKSYSDREGNDSGSWYCSAFFPSVRPLAPAHFAQWQGLVQGLSDRFVYQGTPASGPAAAATAYEQLNSRVTQWHGDTVVEVNSYIEHLAKVGGRIDQLHRDQRKNYDLDCENRLQQFTNLTAEHTSGMEQIRKTFKEEISLRAPVTYWRAKQDGHKKLTRIFGLLSFGAIAVVAVTGSLRLHDVLAIAGPGKVPDPISLAALVLIGGFALWAIRLLVRIFLSNLHLMTDAQERVVMVETYLSLLEAGKVDPDDRSFVLQSLFRPTADGIVKDESLPAILADSMSRAGSR